MGLTLTSSPSSIAKSYDAYVDRCYDEYYGDEAECPECGSYIEFTGDKWEGTETCPDCGYSHWWNNIPD